MTKRPPRGWPVSWMCATTSWRNSNPTRKKRDIFKHCSSKIFSTASKGDWDAYRWSGDAIEPIEPIDLLQPPDRR